VNGETESTWLAFVAAEEAYRHGMASLRHVDMEEALREGLARLPWRRAALAVIGASSVDIAERLLPQLFQQSLVAHSLLAEVRRCILRIPRETLARDLPVLVHAVIADRASDYEAYRRTAELLRILEMWELLGTVIRAASTSPDLDIREVAEDFDGRETA
jgi:hypothetical protein